MTIKVTSADQRLKELDIMLPAPPEPFGTYVEAVQTGNLLFLTGMLPTEGRGVTSMICFVKGKTVISRLEFRGHNTDFGYFSR